MAMKLENCWMILPGHKVGYGDIEIEGEKIAAVTAKGCRRGGDSTKASRLVMPGLINCHGHTAMTLVRGLGSESGGDSPLGIRSAGTDEI